MISIEYENNAIKTAKEDGIKEGIKEEKIRIVKNLLGLKLDINAIK